MMSACGSFLLPSPSGLSLPANLGDTFLEAAKSGGGKIRDSPGISPREEVDDASLLVLCDLTSSKSLLEDVLTGEEVL